MSADTLKGLGDNMTQLTQGPLKNFDTAISQLGKNGSDLGKSINKNSELFGELSSEMAINWKGFDKIAEKYQSTGGTVDGLTKAIALMNTGLVDQQMVLDSLAGKKGSKPIDQLYKDLLPGLLKAQANLGIGGPKTGSGGTATDYSKQYSPLIKHLTDVRKMINAQAEAQKKYNDQLKATQDYQIKQMDYFNQMKNAFTSGNFLGAAMIKDSAKASQADFAATVQQQKQQDALANIDNILSSVQEASTGGKSFAAWKKANPNIAKFTSSKYDSSLLGGLSAADYSKQTGGIVSKANQAQSAAAAAASGGAFQNLVVNVSADNSVIPEQFSKNLSAQIQAAVQKAYAKSNTTNSVTGKVKSK